MLTNVHNSSTFNNRIRSRHAKDHYRTVVKPRAIGLYSIYMGGVDLADQLSSYHQLSNKQLKWWKKVVFSHLLETCVTNARIVYKQQNPRETFDVNYFRLNIISGLLKDYVPPNKKLQRTSTDPSNRTMNSQLQHFPSLNPGKTPKGKRAYPECIVCSNRKYRRCNTYYYCKKCDKPMCAFPCFERYHSLEDYTIRCTPTLHKE